MDAVPNISDNADDLNKSNAPLHSQENDTPRSESGRSHSGSHRSSTHRSGGSSSSGHRHRGHHHHRSRSSAPVFKPKDEVKEAFVLSENSSALFFSFINSVLAFLTAYYLVYFVSQLITSTVAQIFEIKCKIRFEGIYFNDPLNSIKWDFLSTFFIYLFPFILLTLLAFLWRWMVTKSDADEKIFHAVPRILKLKISIHENTGLGKVFNMWVFFHAVSLLFTSLAVEVFSDVELGYLLSSIEIVSSFKIILSTFFLLVLAYIGRHNVKFILRTANSKRLIQSDARRYFIFSQAIFPWITGTLLIMLLHFPDVHISFNIIELLAMGVLFAYPVYKPNATTKINIYRHEAHLTSISGKWGLILLFVYVAFRFLVPLFY